MTDSTPQPRKLNPTREYVSGGLSAWGDSGRALPWAFDDLTRELGDDVYERMLCDAQVAANLNLYTAAVLEDGVNLTSAVSDKTADGYDQAAALVGEVEQMLADMEPHSCRRPAGAEWATARPAAHARSAPLV
jgi:hypothetical protein